MIDTPGALDTPYGYLENYSNLSQFNKSGSISNPMNQPMSEGGTVSKRSTFKSQYQYNSRLDNTYDDSDSQDLSEDDQPQTQAKHGLGYLKS